MNHYVVSSGARGRQLTYPDVTAETDGEDGSEDDNTPSPELVPGLILPIGIGLHQKNAPENQLWVTCSTAELLTA